MKIKSYLFVILLLCLSSITAFAQEREITGKITDAETGEALIGVTIQVKGTTIGTITDFNGNYSIQVTSGDDVLQYSYVGYEGKEVPVGDKTSINIELKEAATELDEVVVVGYGTQKKSDLTGAVSKVSSDKLTKIPSANMSQALQGRASGVTVRQNSGKPGGDISINIRGVGSINDAQPLYVIDGIPIEGSMGNIVDPGDIESIEILKDASATAIYGNRGANGVVIVTTKKGARDGDVKVDFSYYHGWSTIKNSYDMMDANQYSTFTDSLYDISEKSDDFPTALTDSMRAINGWIDTDWQDAIRRTGNTDNYSLNVSGGSEKTRFAISGNYMDENGTLIGTWFNRLNFRANSDFKVNDKLTIGESFLISQSTQRQQSGSNAWQDALVASPLMPVYDPRNTGGYAGPNAALTGSNDKPNPVGLLMLNDKLQKATRIVGNIFANYDIIEGLRYTIKAGQDMDIRRSTTFNPQYQLGWDGSGSSRDNDPATMSESYSLRSLTTFQNLLTYNNTFADAHNLTVLVGQEAQEYKNPSFNASGRIFRDPDKRVLKQAEEAAGVSGSINPHYTMSSYFTRVNYNFRSKYLFTANFRADGSSKFKPGNKWGYFPSISGGWVFSEENFWSSMKSIINNAKLRASWGKVGNQKHIGSWDWQTQLDAPKNSRYIFDDQLYLGSMILESFVNPNISWEASKTTGAGLDMAFLQNKILFSTEYYHRLTEDMLVRVPVSSMAGRVERLPPWVNVGEVLNNGMEFSLEYRKREGAFNYSIASNLTTIHNKVLSDIQKIFKKDLALTEQYHSIGSFYGFVSDGLFEDQDAVNSHAKQTVGGDPTDPEANTMPGDIRFKDLNNDGIINDKDRTVIGKKIPSLDYSLDFSCDYKGIDFSIFLQGMAGYQVYNGLRSRILLPSDGDGGQQIDENKMVDAMNYWTPENTNTDVTRITKTNPNQNDRYSDYWLEDASFLRIKNIQLGYTLPANMVNRINVDRVRIYASVSNLYTFTNYTGYDPEVSGSGNDPGGARIDNGVYPLSMITQVGAQLGF